MHLASGLTLSRGGVLVSSGLPREGLVAHYNFDIRNLLRYSEDLTQWGMGSNVVITADVEGTADRIQQGNQLESVAQGVDVIPETKYTFSFKAKNNGGLAANYRVRDNTNSVDIIPVTSYFDQLSDDDYTLISVTFTTPSGCTTVGVYPHSNAQNADILVKEFQLNDGEGPLPYQKTEDLQTLFDVSGNGNHATLGFQAPPDNNDPRVETYALYFDGNNDRLTDLPALGDEWTIINANDTQIEAEDSDGGSYLHGEPGEGSVYPIDMVGWYIGDVTYRVQYNRVLSAEEHQQAYRYIKKRLTRRGFSIT